MRKDKEKRIQETWFNEHKAELKDLGEIQILNWRKPGSIYYYVRYVFDGHRMYISGDLGEAVFCLTWKADVHSFGNIGIQYFHEKLEAYHEDKYDFESDKAIKRLREWLNDLKQDGRKYDHDEMRELFEQARDCSSHSEWVRIVDEKSDFISELDCDYWEWFYSIGNEITWRIYGYLIGLQMASEQLKHQQ